MTGVQGRKTKGRGCGVALCVNDELEWKEMRRDEMGETEFFWVKITVGKKGTRGSLGRVSWVCYRPPGSGLDMDRDPFHSLN